MSQQVIIGFPRTGVPQGDSQYLAKLASAPGAGDPIRMLFSDENGVKGAISVCADGENAQTVANAMAQAVKDAGGPASGYSAGKIIANGTYSELTGPTPS